MGSAGTHPFSLFERQRITAKDRYRALIDQLQYVARRELIFGMHVHVAVDDPEKAIQVVNGLLPQLAPLLALSASSPFWRGEATGLASSRQMVFSAFPRSGPPPRFRDYVDYAEVVGQLERSGCIADYTHIWWDIRLHPRLGTIEIRICDAVTRVEDAVAIAAYCQALVKQLCEQYDAGEEIPSYHRILTSENKWLAARYGLEAPVMDLGSGRRNRVPVARVMRRTVAEIEPHARELGSERELEGILEILARGSSADRQLRVYNSNRDIVEVAREIAEATEALPTSRLASFPHLERLRVHRGHGSVAGLHGQDSARLDEAQAQRHLPLEAHLEREVDAVGRTANRVERVDERLVPRSRIQGVCPAPVRARRPRHGLPAHVGLLLETVDDRPGEQAVLGDVVGSDAVRDVRPRSRVLDEEERRRVGRDSVEGPHAVQGDHLADTEAARADDRKLAHVERAEDEPAAVRGQAAGRAVVGDEGHSETASEHAPVHDAPAVDPYLGHDRLTPPWQCDVADRPGGCAYPGPTGRDAGGRKTGIAARSRCEDDRRDHGEGCKDDSHLFSFQIGPTTHASCAARAIWSTVRTRPFGSRSATVPRSSDGVTAQRLPNVTL